PDTTRQIASSLLPTSIVLAVLRLQRLRGAAGFIERPHQRLGVAMGGDNPARGSLSYRPKQVRPVGMIGDHKAPIHIAAPAIAPQSHPSGGKPLLRLAKTPQP